LKKICFAKKGDLEMVNVIASIYVKEGQMPQFMDIFKSNVPKVLKEPGCIEYLPTLDLPAGLPPQELNNNVATIIEKWRSLDDLKAHLSAPHMQDYQEKVKNLVDKVSIKVLEEA
jgi:quinol monooxygenase YgiN